MTDCEATTSLQVDIMKNQIPQSDMTWSVKDKQIYTAPTNPLTHDIRHTIQQPPNQPTNKPRPTGQDIQACTATESSEENEENETTSQWRYKEPTDWTGTNTDMQDHDQVPPLFKCASAPKYAVISTPFMLSECCPVSEHRLDSLTHRLVVGLLITSHPDSLRRRSQSTRLFQD